MTIYSLNDIGFIVMVYAIFIAVPISIIILIWHIVKDCIQEAKKTHTPNNQDRF